MGVVQRSSEQPAPAGWEMGVRGPHTFRMLSSGAIPSPLSHFTDAQALQGPCWGTAARVHPPGSTGLRGRSGENPSWQEPLQRGTSRPWAFQSGRESCPIFHTQQWWRSDCAGPCLRSHPRARRTSSCRLTTGEHGPPGLAL